MRPAWWQPVSRWLQEHPDRPRAALLAVTLALTVVLLLIDVTRPALTAPLRSGAAALFSPVQSATTGWSQDELTRVIRERDALAAQVSELEAQLHSTEQLTTLQQASAGWGDYELLPTRVVGVAYGSTPVAGRTVTIDAGAQEGVSVDQTVVSSQGLVGRVVRVSSTSADVVLLGGPDVVVGVRFGSQGALGSVSAQPAPGLPPRESGELTLTAIGDSRITEGEVVTTLGSPDSRPYVAGVPLGTVTSVDPDNGQLGRTAAVQPFVDPDTLDLVAVVLLEEPS